MSFFALNNRYLTRGTRPMIHCDTRRDLVNLTILVVNRTPLKVQNGNDRGWRHSRMLEHAAVRQYTFPCLAVIYAPREAEAIRSTFT